LSIQDDVITIINLFIDKINISNKNISITPFEEGELEIDEEEDGYTVEC